MVNAVKGVQSENRAPSSPFCLLLGDDSLFFWPRCSLEFQVTRARLDVCGLGLETGHCYQLDGLEVVGLGLNNVLL